MIERSRMIEREFDSGIEEEGLKRTPKRSKFSHSDASIPLMNTFTPVDVNSAEASLWSYLF